MADVSGLPGPNADIWDWQLEGSCRGEDPGIFFHPEGERGPARAARDFAAARSDFTLEPPPRPFDESAGTVVHTYYNSAWLRRAV